MTPREVRNLIEGGEGPRVEFKSDSTQPESVARSLCSLLNTAGGQLLIGLESRGVVKGVEEVEATRKLLKSELPRLISPQAPWSIEAIQHEGADLLLIDVAEGQGKPYVTGGGIYLRREGPAKPVPADRDEISRLIIRRAESSLRWERQTAVGFEVSDLDQGLIRETLSRATSANRWPGHAADVEGFLTSLGLAERGQVTNAAVVLYGKNPCRILPQARVRLLVASEGKTGGRFELDRVFEGCLIQTAMDLPEALKLHVDGVETTFSKDWQHSTRPIAPVMALREGIMNALVHRDYALLGSVTLSVVPPKIQISNPGGLPGGLTPRDLKRSHLSLPRNPDIAHVCFLHDLINKVGRGTQRILENCRAARLPEPKWESTPHETTLTLFSRPSNLPRSQAGLNERQREILAAIRTQGAITPGKLALLFGSSVTGRKIRNDLQLMLEAGLIERRGRGRAITYSHRD